MPVPGASFAEIPHGQIRMNPVQPRSEFDEDAFKDFDCTHEVLAVKVGKSRPHVTNTLRLLTLTPAIQRRVAAGVITAGHARALLGLKSVEEPAA